MRIDVLLDRLDRVRQAGPGRWMACCPAHDDKNPSLSLRELDDGRILLHDFAGCAAADVLSAIGLTLADLYPDRLGDHLAPTRDRKHRHAASEALKALDADALLVVVAAENIAAGVALDDADRELLAGTVSRIHAARCAAT